MDSSYVEEVFKHLGIESTNPGYFNSKAHMEECKAQLQDAGQPNEELKLLESEYQTLVNARENETRPYRYIPESFNALEMLSTWLERGQYPPPEVLIAINDAYNFYVGGMGAIDVESVFFSKPIKGAGSYARRKIRGMEETFRDFHREVKWQKAGEKHFVWKKESLEDMAEKYLNSGDVVYLPDSDDPVGSFLRRYRRWLKEISDK